MVSAVPVKTKHDNLIFILLLTMLVILRFPLLILPSFNLLPVSHESAFEIYTIGTYFISAVMILLKRDDLLKYNMGFFSVALFIAAPFIYPVAFYVLTPQISMLLSPDIIIRPIISACLLIALLKLRVKLPRAGMKKSVFWFFTAAAAGIGFAIILGLILRQQTTVFSTEFNIAKYLPCAFFIQLNNAAVCEEPLFRGFLWGFLRELHWKDHWILLFQAFTFMIGHIYYIDKALISLFIVVPVGGILLGIIAWRSKSAGASMITHSLVNSVGNIVSHFSF
ncbi:MAG: CPBP family glutamic-type intramembrane protease [Eubacteriales bacterium]